MSQIEQPWNDHRLKLNGVYIGCVTQANADLIMGMQKELSAALERIQALEANAPKVWDKIPFPPSWVVEPDHFVPVKHPPEPYKIVAVKYDSGVVGYSWSEGTDSVGEFDNMHGEVVEWRFLGPREVPDPETLRLHAEMLARNPEIRAKFENQNVENH